ncbi:hypothetical protein ACHAW6_007214 [Cyclotella cf. meneghiniana]
MAAEEDRTILLSYDTIQILYLPRKALCLVTTNFCFSSFHYLHSLPRLYIKQLRSYLQHISSNRIMTILLDHIPTANNSSARPLRVTQRQQDCPKLNGSCATAQSPCGSPPRYRDSQSRPHKAPRSISPGGTPASSPCLRGGPSPPAAPRSRVRWAAQLESSVVTRPKTCREDIPTLYYSRADERRFRKEAELEEREELLPSSPPIDSWTACGGDIQRSHPERRDYAISKAVVIFGDTTKTYDSSIWSFPSGGCAAESQAVKDSAFSFDDPAFWNGILTWS